MLKKKYFFDTDYCTVADLFSYVVLHIHRLYSFSFPQLEYSAYYQKMYDGQYSLVIAKLPPYSRILQNRKYLVHYISITFDSYREMVSFLKSLFLPVVFSFDKIYSYKRKILITKRLMFNYKNIVDYAINVTK